MFIFFLDLVMLFDLYTILSNADSVRSLVKTGTVTNRAVNLSWQLIELCNKSRKKGNGLYILIIIQIYIKTVGAIFSLFINPIPNRKKLKQVIAVALN